MRSTRGVVLAILVTVMAGCSSGPVISQINASDPVFAGLDPAVVAEALASPVVKERVGGDDLAMARARMQGIVRNFTLCRSALVVYQGWLKAGTPPAFPKQPVPSNPGMWASDSDTANREFGAAAAGGDIAVLRAKLTDKNDCGSWVPRTPGDVTGPTIADVVNGKG